MERDLELLLSRCLDGELSDDDAQRFETLLNENAEFRNAFLNLLRHERVTRTLLDVNGGLNVAEQVRLKVKATASGEGFVARIHNEIDRKKRGETASNVVQMHRPAFSRAARWAAGLAAMLLLCAGIYFVTTRQDSSKQLASPDLNVAPPEHPKPDVNVAENKPVSPGSSSTFTAIPARQNGAPLGYWEFLPSAYRSNPEQRFAVVIFFHGLDEGGDGSVAQLQKVLKLGPPALLKDPGHPIHDVFEKNNVIVLSPQCRAKPEWWHSHDIVPFMDFVFAHYRSRIDRRRIYLTGLSAGALGIHELMDTRPDKAQHAAAILVTATVGGAGAVGKPFAGPAVGAVIPYWALGSVGDNPSQTIAGMDKMAGIISGKPPTDLFKTYPGPEQAQTATFDAKTGWTWQKGIAGNNLGATLRLTLYPGSGHGSSMAAYDNIECWNWLFSQKAVTGNEVLDKF